MSALTANIINGLKKSGDKSVAVHHAGFFKTHKGGYGEGDKFFGLPVPQTRSIAKNYYKQLTLKETEELLRNPYHEVRLLALVVLTLKHAKADTETKNDIENIYLKNTKYINNWDLVDVSCYRILGPRWLNSDLKELWAMAKSGNLWQERISVITTMYFIINGHCQTTVKLAEHFLDHKHDLMHKATGWMLREAGKRNEEILIGFLNKHHKQMPRTMLRYSIEKLTAAQKAHYMRK